MLSAIDAEFAAALALVLPPPPLPVDPDTLRRQSGVDPTAATPTLMHAAALVPDSLLYVQSDVQRADSVEACAEAMFPKPYPVPSTQIRSPVVLSRKVLSRLADAAVLVAARIIPFLSEIQSQVCLVCVCVCAGAGAGVR